MIPPVIPLYVGDQTYEARLYYGQDVRITLRELPGSSVHMVCTSPPYWGLRDYGTEPVVWGGDPLCEHEWEEVVPQDSRHRHIAENSTKEGSVAEQWDYPEDHGSYCAHCGAWRGSLGLEPTPEEFVAHLVEVFREISRVLRPDGTLWVNLGDTYFAGGSTTESSNNNRNYEHLCTLQTRSTDGQSQRPIKSRTHNYLKPKDLVGIPWRFALAMQQEGWYLRADIIWAKNNPMPESVRDRTTRAHEYIFLFAHPDSKGSYFYDAEAIKEETAQPGRVRADTFGGKSWEHRQQHSEGGLYMGSTTRNKRSVWSVNPKPYPGAHFAVWPEELVRPMILAGTSEHGVCASCGTPWERERLSLEVEEKEGVSIGGDPSRHDGGVRTKDPTGGGGNVLASRTAFGAWLPGCACLDPSPAPATVLDPFSGSATTGRVAVTSGRHYIGTDLNPEYLSLAQSRVLGLAAPRESVELDENTILELFRL